ncbi:TPA: thermonuclease family protein [Pseudomonas aeruginosa]|jgi:micrococcal nuclease|nr:thermonuclease family protein [Acidovorax sp. YS12]HEP9230319.1 thermonuclease family protein [Pseudomonas aeruginosa]
MTMLRAALAALLILPALAWADPAEVVGVLDGDTVAVLSPDRKMTRCRLFGIDAPEKGQAFGQASKKVLSDLTYRKTLDVRVVDTDRYGRAVCRLTLAGVDINREQVARGMAWVYRRYNQEPAYYEAEAAARAARLGLWADANPVPPWDYRHDQAGAREHARVAPRMTN